MNADRVSRPRPKNVGPELLAFLLRPGIGALVDQGDELGDVSQDLEEFGFCGFPAQIATYISELARLLLSCSAKWASNANLQPTWSSTASRRSAISICLSRGGNGISTELTIEVFKFLTVAPAAARANCA